MRITNRTFRTAALAGITSLLTAGCGGSDPDTFGDSYSFESRFSSSVDSVSYTGQTVRHTLLRALDRYLSELTDEVDRGRAPDDLISDLNFYYAFAEEGTSATIDVGLDLPLDQSTYADFANVSNLQSKIAGNDEKGQHKTWSTDFAGWPDADSPDALVQAWFATLDELVTARQSAEPPLDPAGQPIEAVLIGPDGRHYGELIEKFILGAVTFSQATDDYLDSDTEDHGILVANVRDEDAMYTVLEHHWDEAFGYYGAARTAALQRDEDVAALGYHDADDSGTLDLMSEVYFGIAINAAKRDIGSATGTDFSGEIFDAFLAGRSLIAKADEELTEGQKRELLGHRDTIVHGWEHIIAANSVHYINEILTDLDALGSDAYSFSDHAKHWSELKGFALSLQFSPHSAMTDADFRQLHQRIGATPELNGDAVDDRKSALLEARDLLGATYGFDDADLEAW